MFLDRILEGQNGKKTLKLKIIDKTVTIWNGRKLIS